MNIRNDAFNICHNLAQKWYVKPFFDRIEGKNKGLIGCLVERLIGLKNSNKARDFTDGELKLISLKKLISGTITVKETVAITMHDPEI